MRIGVVLLDGRDDVLRELQSRRVLAIPAGESVVRFLPPYVIADAHIVEAVAALEGALGESGRCGSAAVSA